MAKAIIVDIKPGYTGSVIKTDYVNSTISGEAHTAKITDIVHNAKPVNVDYVIAKATGEVHTAKMMSILPFYVKFTTIGIEGGYGPSNPAPIGIAVIGTNNYIL
jgi:hypothetical protein